MKYPAAGKCIATLLLPIWLACACNQNNDRKMFAGFATLIKGNKVIIISCVRCDFVVDRLNKIIREEPALLDGYTFAGDTTCTETFLWRHKMEPYSQRQLDDISVDFYNLLVIRKNDKGKVTFIRLVETMAALDLKKYL